MKQIVVRAPSNIALIKYMGKVDFSQNIPANASLSLTLDQLATWLQIHRIPTDERLDKTMEWKSGWNPVGNTLLQHVEKEGPRRSENFLKKVYAHWDQVVDFAKKDFNRWDLALVQDVRFEVQSVNTFPSGAGIASSASAFAAMTLGFSAALSREPQFFREVYERSPDLRKALAKVSRKGSGSSIRSFEGPFVKWQGDEAESLAYTGEPLADTVLVISEAEKRVSSTEAHRRVMSSPLWLGRPERANQRVRIVQDQLSLGNWNEICEMIFQETLEMHSLFHTSSDPFTYWQPKTVEVLNWVIENRKLDPRWVGVAVTLDAGPNIHFLTSQARQAEWVSYLREQFPELSLLTDSSGKGASLEKIW